MYVLKGNEVKYAHEGNGNALFACPSNDGKYVFSALGTFTNQLSGFVTPNLAETECHFSWGTAPNELTKEASCTEKVPAGSEPSKRVEVTAPISGLALRMDIFLTFSKPNNNHTIILNLITQPHLVAKQNPHVVQHVPVLAPRE